MNIRFLLSLLILVGATYAAAQTVNVQQSTPNRNGINTPALAAPADQGAMAHLPGISGDYFALDSVTIGRRFHIFVKLPESYDKEPRRHYPVSYLLDGDTSFPMLAPTHLFLNYDEGLPEAIIVGIAYGGLDPSINKRDIDFRDTLEDGSPGGAPALLAMLEKELLPSIDARYRTDPAKRTLFGQSRGGSFVLYAANKRPDLFFGFTASNPGRENDKHLYGWNKVPSAPHSGATLTVTSGSRDRDYLREGAIEWSAWIKGRTDLPWKAELITIEGGTHAAAAGQAYRAGMLRAFGIADKNQPR